MLINWSRSKNTAISVCSTSAVGVVLWSMLTYVAIPYQVFSSRSPASWWGCWIGAACAVVVQRAVGRRLSRLDGATAPRDRLRGAYDGVLADVGDQLVCHHPSVILIFVISGLMSAIAGFHRPALESMTPQLVDRDDLQRSRRWDR